jgi:hypothetical protein
VQGPFVSASSSLLTLADLLSLLPLRGAARDLSSGSGLTANRINLPYASELYPASGISSRSPRPALCYRPLPALHLSLAADVVTWLEPRTRHQPEKLKKLSKNDSLFTLSISGVNEKYAFVSTRFFNRVHAVHRPVPGNSATWKHNSRRNPCRTRLFPHQGWNLPTEQARPISDHL